MPRKPQTHKQWGEIKRYVRRMMLFRGSFWTTTCARSNKPHPRNLVLKFMWLNLVLRWEQQSMIKFCSLENLWWNCFGIRYQGVRNGLSWNCISKQRLIYSVQTTLTTFLKTQECRVPKQNLGTRFTGWFTTFLQFRSTNSNKSDIFCWQTGEILGNNDLRQLISKCSL